MLVMPPKYRRVIFPSATGRSATARAAYSRSLASVARSAGVMKSRSGAGFTRPVGYYGRYAGAGGPVTGGELKFHDIDWDEAAADLSAGVISNTSSVVLIGQGITESTRIGRKARIRSIGWRGQIKLAAGSGAGPLAPETVRLIIVHDKQCNGAAPAVSGTNGLLVAANYQSFNNLINKGRFNVLSDKTYVINPSAGAGNGSANDFSAHTRAFTFFKKCDIPMEYSGVANPSVITEVRSNNIFGIMINETAGSSVSLDSKFRFRFSDG